MVPQVRARTSSPCTLARRAVLPCDTAVARSWKLVYTNPRYGFVRWVRTMPEPMRYWTVFSTMRMSTRPERYMYLPRMSPWRVSSAVQVRVQTAQGQALAPVSSRTPSSVLIMVWYVGSASSVIMSPTSTTKYSSGSPAARARSSRTWSSNISDDESGKKSVGCQHSSTGLSSGSSDVA
uniref:Uncharacterized protein n=1 Tax=Oryza brachyantha TaxID=4533 RepID=J3L6F5_ORYBR